MTHEINQDRPANLNTLKVFLEKTAAKYLIEAGSEERFLEKAGEIDRIQGQIQIEQQRGILMQIPRCMVPEIPPRRIGQRCGCQAQGDYTAGLF